jgi:hypothetical protein
VNGPGRDCADHMDGSGGGTPAQLGPHGHRARRSPRCLSSVWESSAPASRGSSNCSPRHTRVEGQLPGRCHSKPNVSDIESRHPPARAIRERAFVEDTAARFTVAFTVTGIDSAPMSEKGKSMSTDSMSTAAAKAVVRRNTEEVQIGIWIDAIEL